MLTSWFWRCQKRNPLLYELFLLSYFPNHLIQCMIDESNWLLDGLKDVHWSSLLMSCFRSLYLTESRNFRTRRDLRDCLGETFIFVDDRPWPAEVEIRQLVIQPLHDEAELEPWPVALQLWSVWPLGAIGPFWFSTLILENLVQINN